MAAGEVTLDAERTCRQCRERLAVQGALPWCLAMFWWTSEDFLAGDAYCSDCAGGFTFLALVVLAVLLVIGFVVALALL